MGEQASQALAMQEFQTRSAYRLRPVPAGLWRMTQRWNDLLFAHWPVSAEAINKLLPAGLEADTFQGSAWLGVVPFWLDRIKFRAIPSVPGMRGFPDLNLRTYVREQQSGAAGLYFFSLDASNLVSVALARGVFHLPYHWAEMRLDQRSEREFSFFSRRRMTASPVVFKARYRGLGPTHKLVEGRAGTLEHFLMERSQLFTRNHAGRPVRSNLHQVPWPLEEAEAEIEQNDLGRSIGIELPNVEPVLHYTRRLAVYVWPSEQVLPSLAARPITAVATPSI